MTQVQLDIPDELLAKIDQLTDDRDEWIIQAIQAQTERSAAHDERDVLANLNRWMR